MDHLKNLLEGACRVLQLDSGRDYIRPDRRGFSRDIYALRGDAKRVCRGLKRNADQYGKSFHYR